MRATYYRKRVIKLIDDYHKRKIARVEVSEWAREALASRDFDKLPSDIQYAITALCNIHDFCLPPAACDVELIKLRIFLR